MCECRCFHSHFNANVGTVFYEVSAASDPIEQRPGTIEGFAELPKSGILIFSVVRYKRDRKTG